MRDEDDLALYGRRIGRLQRLHTVKLDDFGLESLGRGSAAVAERGQDERLREGRDDLGTGFAAFPIGKLETFDPDVGEAERLELRDRPVAGARLGLAAGLALADFGGEPFNDVPGEVVAQRGVAQSRGFLRSGLGEEGRGEGGGGAQRRHQDFLHGVGR